MAVINNWWGENNIGWGASYPESWFGNVNETNSWGIIYPGTAEGSIIYADSTLFTADSTSYYADNGTEEAQSSSGTSPGTLVNTPYYKMAALLSMNGVTFINVDGSAPDSGFASTLNSLTAKLSSAYNSVTNAPFYIDQNTIQVGAFLTDASGIFINSNDTHNTDYSLFYSDFSSPRYAAVTTSLRGSSPYFDPSETLIIKVEQSNGYVKITELIQVAYVDGSSTNYAHFTDANYTSACSETGGINHTGIVYYSGSVFPPTSGTIIYAASTSNPYYGGNYWYGISQTKYASSFDKMVKISSTTAEVLNSYDCP